MSCDRYKTHQNRYCSILFTHRLTQRDIWEQKRSQTPVKCLTAAVCMKPLQYCWTSLDWSCYIGIMPASGIIPISKSAAGNSMFSCSITSVGSGRGPPPAAFPELCHPIVEQGDCVFTQREGNWHCSSISVTLDLWFRVFVYRSISGQETSQSDWPECHRPHWRPEKRFGV